VHLNVSEIYPKWNRSRAQGKQPSGALAPCHVAKPVELSQEGLIPIEHMDGPQGDAMFRHVCRPGLEGMVSKRKASRYRSGPTQDWRKIRCLDYERSPTA